MEPFALIHEPHVNGEQLILFLHRSLLGSKYYSPRYGLLYLKYSSKVIYELYVHMHIPYVSVMCEYRTFPYLLVSLRSFTTCILLRLSVSP
jgi:hypothetical protein